MTREEAEEEVFICNETAFSLAQKAYSEKTGRELCANCEYLAERVAQRYFALMRGEAPQAFGAFDDMILMKVLPRITGDTEMVMRIFAGNPVQDKEPRALDDPDVGGLAKLLGKESASFGKMKEIVKRGESSGSGTLTFWP